MAEVPCHCRQKRRPSILDMYRNYSESIASTTIITSIISETGINNNNENISSVVGGTASGLAPTKYFHRPEYMEKFSESRRQCFKNAKSTVKDSDEIVRELREDIFGEDRVFLGPFGSRKAIYMDHGSSGMSLRGIEDFIQENVLPLNNTPHKEINTSHNASQMAGYRTESRRLIMKLCGGSAEDVLIFCRSGSLEAVHKLVHSIQYPDEPPPIVFVGPFEPHANLKPWKETASEIISIPEDGYGTIDIKYLEDKLKKTTANKSNRGRLVVGIFSAASSVTGALSDDVAVTVMMHNYGGLAVWDYATAAPHVKISMNPQTGDARLDELAKKDALFFSGNKFIGGPQSTGVLIAKKSSFRNPVPYAGSGQSTHHYLNGGSQKEEDCTADIIGSIRLGLVFQLKNTIGEAFVITREAFYTKKALETWESLPQMKILGHKKNPRIPIISFMVQHIQTGYFLHHEFIVALLNDLFGIQCRGGCLCSGPYAEELLGIDSQLAEEYSKISSKPNASVSFDEERKYERIFKPGFVRISLPFHASKEEIDYVIQAVKLVAEHGWKLLPFYQFNNEEASFRFQANQKDEEQNKTINSFHLISSYPRPPVQEFHPTYDECLKYAQELVESVQNVLLNFQMESISKEFAPETNQFRWFLLPLESLNWAQKSKNVSKSPLPFTLKNHYKSRKSGDLLKNWHIGSIPNLICSKSCWIEDKAEFHHKLDRISKRFKLFKILDKKLGLKDSDDELGGYASDDGFLSIQRRSSSRSRSGSIASVLSSYSSGFHDDCALRS